MVRHYYNRLRNNIQYFYLPSSLSADTLNCPPTPRSHRELESKGHSANNLAWSPVLAQERPGVPRWNSIQDTHSCYQRRHRTWKCMFFLLVNPSSADKYHRLL